MQAGFGLLHQAAHILKNEAQLDGAAVRRKYRRHVRAMVRKAPRSGPLREAIDHFVKVTESYWPGLFRCFDVPDLPRTNNDLEHLFGSTRHHERRCTGRKTASPGLVLRGPVRIIAGLGTRQQEFGAADLVPSSVQVWRDTRATLQRGRQLRVLRRRFRRNPAAYLRELEDILLKPALPA